MQAIGIVRVSQTAGREGDSLASPEEQRKRIEEACARGDLSLTAVHEELDVSGGTPLERREGLRAAVEAVEAKEAEVIVVAYFDRLVRSLRVQDEVVSRVEAAGGRVLALDVGRVSGETAGQWLSGTMLGAMSEYFRRSVKERSAAAQAMAVERGVLPFPNVPPGYLRGEDGVLVPDPETRDVVVAAFELRGDGETISTCREHLQAGGVERSYHSVQAMFGSRTYLGEIHFGELVNLAAHEPLVDLETWKQANAAKVSRGRRAKSERLLARLGVLRCGSCGARMVATTAGKGKYAFYRCPPSGDCSKRMTISAPIAERVVSEKVRELLADEEGHTSAHDEAREAEERAERAQAELDAALRVVAGFENEAATRERLAELGAIRDQAVDRASQLRGLDSGLTITVRENWDDFLAEEKRKLIRAVVESATVGLGRGAERISVVFHHEAAGD